MQPFYRLGFLKRRRSSTKKENVMFAFFILTARYAGFNIKIAIHII